MGTNDFIILLPPSEGKAPGGDVSRPWTPASGTFGGVLGEARQHLCDRLSTARGGDALLLGVKGAHLERARQANSSLAGSPSLAAWRRYTGVVWDHLDLESIPATARNKVLKRIFVPSGLAGLVRADDPLPDYRLKMGARLGGVGLVSTWWRQDLTVALARATRARPIIDLLTIEHRAAFDWANLPTAVRIDLVSKSGAIVGGHNAKAAKGLLARHLLDSESSVSLRSKVSSFSHPDYRARITE